MTGKVKLVSAGGGSVSLATPSTGSNRTLTLPDADVTIPNAIPSADAGYSKNVLTTQGDTLYASGANTLARLAKGTAGQTLKMNSGATAPEWTTVTAGFETEEYDEWRLTTEFTGPVDPLTANLERPDTGNFEKIGTGVTQSSGVWTFPSTGKWLITTNSTHYKQGTARYPGSIHHTTVDNGSNWVETAQGYGWIDYGSNAAGNTVTVRTLFDCTNTSTHKFKWEIHDSDGDGTTTWGVTGRNLTYISFWKIGST